MLLANTNASDRPTIIKMTQVFLPPDLETDSSTLYCYTNQTSQIMIARIYGFEDRHCERVIFPGEKFLFEAEDNCELGISRQTNAGIVEDIIPCSKLKTQTKLPQNIAQII